MIMKFHKDGTLPQTREIFVFGSNLAGIHGAGAARVAYREFGAVWGQGSGFSLTTTFIGQGSYAIPTKDQKINTLPLEDIKPYIDKFVEFTNEYPGWWYFVTRIGCGLAGYRDEQIAPMFRGAKNCSFAEEWRPYLDA
jgi:hypothetical protein